MFSGMSPDMGLSELELMQLLREYDRDGLDEILAPMAQSITSGMLDEEGLLPQQLTDAFRQQEGYDDFEQQLLDIGRQRAAMEEADRDYAARLSNMVTQKREDQRIAEGDALAERYDSPGYEVNYNIAGRYGPGVRKVQPENTDEPDMTVDEFMEMKNRQRDAQDVMGMPPIQSNVRSMTQPTKPSAKKTAAPKTTTGGDNRGNLAPLAGESFEDYKNRMEGQDLRALAMDDPEYQRRMARRDDAAARRGLDLPSQVGAAYTTEIALVKADLNKQREFFGKLENKTDAKAAAAMEQITRTQRKLNNLEKKQKLAAPRYGSLIRGSLEDRILRQSFETGPSSPYEKGAGGSTGPIDPEMLQ